MAVLRDFFNTQAIQHLSILDRLQEQITTCRKIETKHLRFLIRSKLLKQIDSCIKKKSIQGLVRDLVKHQVGESTMNDIWEKRCKSVRESVDVLNRIAKIDDSLRELKKETDLKVRVLSFNLNTNLEEQSKPTVKKSAKEDWIRDVKSSSTSQTPFMQTLREKTTKNLTNYNTNIYDFLPQNT